MSRITRSTTSAAAGMTDSPRRIIHTMEVDNDSSGDDLFVSDGEYVDSEMGDASEEEYEEDEDEENFARATSRARSRRASTGKTTETKPTLSRVAMIAAQAREEYALSGQPKKKETKPESAKNKNSKGHNHAPNNGRNLGRMVNKYGNGADQYLMLCMVYELAAKSIEVPWQEIADRYSSEKKTTGQSVRIHIRNLRRERIESGGVVPPDITGLGPQQYYNLRGIRAAVNEDTHEVQFVEVGKTENLKPFHASDGVKPLTTDSKIVPADHQKCALRRVGTVLEDLTREARAGKRLIALPRKRARGGTTRKKYNMEGVLAKAAATNALTNPDAFMRDQMQQAQALQETQAMQEAMRRRTTAIDFEKYQQEAIKAMNVAQALQDAEDLAARTEATDADCDGDDDDYLQQPASSGVTGHAVHAAFSAPPVSESLPTFGGSKSFLELNFANDTDSQQPTSLARQEGLPGPPRAFATNFVADKKTSRRAAQREQALMLSAGDIYIRNSLKGNPAFGRQTTAAPSDANKIIGNREESAAPSNENVQRIIPSIESVETFFPKENHQKEEENYHYDQAIILNGGFNVPPIADNSPHFNRKNEHARMETSSFSNDSGVVNETAKRADCGTEAHMSVDDSTSAGGENNASIDLTGHDMMTQVHRDDRPGVGWREAVSPGRFVEAHTRTNAFGFFHPNGTAVDSSEPVMLPVVRSDAEYSRQEFQREIAPVMPIPEKYEPAHNQAVPQYSAGPQPAAVPEVVHNRGAESMLPNIMGHQPNALVMDGMFAVDGNHQYQHGQSTSNAENGLPTHGQYAPDSPAAADASFDHSQHTKPATYSDGDYQLFGDQSMAQESNFDNAVDSYTELLERNSPVFSDEGDQSLGAHKRAPEAEESPRAAKRMRSD